MNGLNAHDAPAERESDHRSVCEALTPIEKFDTARLAPRHRLAYWNELVDQFYAGTWVNAAKPDFAAEMWRWQVGELNMIRPVSDPAQVGRSADPSGSDENLVLHLQRRGRSRQIQERRETALAPGDFVLLSPARGYTIDATSHEMLVIEFPRQLIAGKVRNLDDRLATLVAGTGPSQRVFHDFLLSLWRQGDQSQADPDWQSGVGNVFADLLALALNISATGASDQPGSALRRRVLSLIEAWLSDPDLRTSAIAEELGVSTRTVQSLFVSMGTTPGAYIAERRLQRAAEMLLSNPMMSVTEVAFEIGFNDSAYFARCFRQRFDMSASAYRARG